MAMRLPDLWEDNLATYLRIMRMRPRFSSVLFRIAAMKIRRELLTEDAVKVTRYVCATWRVDRLPVLADALEDAGCDQPDILGSLRGTVHGRVWPLVVINNTCETYNATRGTAISALRG